MPDCANRTAPLVAPIYKLPLAPSLASVRVPLLTLVLAFFVASTTFGQAAPPADNATPSGTTQPGGTQPATPGTTPAAPAGTVGNQPPAPARNASTEVTGRTPVHASGQPSTARRAGNRDSKGVGSRKGAGNRDSNPDPNGDHPLLPIPALGNSLGIPSGTPIRVRLKADADSGHAHNGDTLNATLADPLANMPAGTPVQLTVVQVAKAGSMLSYGELSVQVVSINQHPVLSDTITALGKEGRKELPDAAPARGTEAIFSKDQTVTLPAA